MSAEAIRMQDLASKLSKKISGGSGSDTPDLTAGWATLSRTHPSTASGLAWWGSGPRSPRLGPKPWSPSTFQPWLRVAPLAYILNFKSTHVTYTLAFTAAVSE